MREREEEEFLRFYENIRTTRKDRRREGGYKDPTKII
jgi:hypothetical protein